METRKSLPIVYLFVCLFTLQLFAQNTPDFRFSTIDNRESKLSEVYKKGPVLINFWALWCKPCRAEIKALQEIYSEYSDEGFTILGFNQDSPRSAAKVKSFVSSQGIDYPVILDGDTEIFRKFNGQAMPYSILIDKNGKIVYKHTGYLPGDEVRLREEIKKALE